MTLSIYAETTLPTLFGKMRLRVYRHGASSANKSEPLALVSGYIDRTRPVNLRIHSACLTSEVLGSCKCDCKHQLDVALAYIAKHTGVVIYLHQEGRGIGLGDKVRVYALQEQGYDTVEANEMLHLPVDAREYDEAISILRDLGIGRVNLLTNNPEKVAALTSHRITVEDRIALPSEFAPDAQGYMDTKRIKMGHLI